MTASKWREMVEQKAFRGKLWAAFGMEQLARKMWERFTIDMALSRSVSADEEKERQDGVDSDWRQETPQKEELELVQHSSDLRFEGIMMRSACEAVKSGDWRK